MQIGDVHYPEAVSESLGDVKDRAFPEGVRDVTTITPMQFVLRAAMREAERRKVHSVLFCGDLTSCGKAEEYRKCVAHFHQALNLGSYGPRRIHAVPGNHDVDRALVNSTELFAKFASFEQAWQDVGLDILAVRSPRITNVASGNSRLRLYSVNSSIGCGEVRHLPSKVRDEIQAVLAKHVVAAGGIESAFDMIGEALDTPAFQKDDIETVCEDIERQNPNVLPVILAHHNLLPQSLLRIEMYTELINSGYVRSRLGKLNRPIIYCHGHIHHNPMETVRQVQLSGSMLLCIAAPAFSRGFNIIQVEYSSKNHPLGCRVRRFELDQHDGAIVPSETRIPFDVAHNRPISVVAHDSLPRILSQLPDRDMRFSELARATQTPANEHEDLKTALIEAEWLRLIAVANADEAVEHWNLRRLPR